MQRSVGGGIAIITGMVVLSASTTIAPPPASAAAPAQPPMCAALLKKPKPTADELRALVAFCTTAPAKASLGAKPPTEPTGDAAQKPAQSSRFLHAVNDFLQQPTAQGGTAAASNGAAPGITVAREATPTPPQVGAGNSAAAGTTPLPAATPIGGSPGAPAGTDPNKNGTANVLAGLTDDQLLLLANAIRLKAENGGAAMALSASDVKANASAAATRESERLRARCQYRANTMAFLSGLVTLARAPKIIDNAKFLVLAAPLPFSACEKPVDLSLSSPVVPAAITLTPGGDPYTLNILEGGYRGTFSVTPALNGIIDIAPVSKDNGKTFLRDQFQLKATSTATAVKATTLTVQDENGQTRPILVNFAAVPTPVPTPVPTATPVPPASAPPSPVVPAPVTTKSP